VFTLRMAVAGPMVVMADPEAVPRLVDADPVRAHAGEGRRRMLPLASPRSVFGGDDEHHRLARGALEPAFSPEAVAARAPGMTRIAAAHVEGWPRGRPFRALPRLRALLDEIFVRLVLGISHEERARLLTAAIGRMMWTPGNPPLPIPGERNGLLGAAAGAFFERRRAPVARLLAQEISERRRDPDEDGGSVVAAVARADSYESPDALAEQLTVVVMAAQEPPAAALTWLLERLGGDPQAADWFEAGGERRSAVVRESLRLRPAAVAAIRRLTWAFPLPGGGELLPGTVAMVPIPLVHRDPSAFPDPESFRPGRWIQADPPETTFLPFGGGARRCIGEHLAHAYIDTVMPVIRRLVALRPAWPQPERMVIRATILVPHRGGLMVEPD
jgi:cytochrome P450